MGTVQDWDDRLYKNSQRGQLCKPAAINLIRNMEHIRIKSYILWTAHIDDVKILLIIK